MANVNLGEAKLNIYISASDILRVPEAAVDIFMLYLSY